MKSLTYALLILPIVGTLAAPIQPEQLSPVRRDSTASLARRDSLVPSPEAASQPTRRDSQSKAKGLKRSIDSATETDDAAPIARRSSQAKGIKRTADPEPESETPAAAAADDVAAPLLAKRSSRAKGLKRSADPEPDAETPEDDDDAVAAPPVRRASQAKGINWRRSLDAAIDHTDIPEDAELVDPVVEMVARSEDAEEEAPAAAAAVEGAKKVVRWLWPTADELPTQSGAPDVNIIVGAGVDADGVVAADGDVGAVL